MFTLISSLILNAAIAAAPLTVADEPTQQAIEDFVRNESGGQREIKTAEFESEAAGARLAAKNSYFWPTLKASGAVSAANTKYPQETMTSQRFEAGVGLQQNLFRGGVDVIGAEVAASDLEIKKLEEEKIALIMQRKLLLAMREAWAATVRTDLANDTLLQAKNIFAASQRKRKAGLAGEIDIIQAASSVTHADVSLKKLDLQNRLRTVELEQLITNKDLARQLLLRIKNKTFPFRETLTTTPVLSFDERILNLGYSSQMKEISKLNRERFSPTIDGQANLSKYKTQSSPQSLSANSDPDYTISLGLSIGLPLFSPGRADEQAALSASLGAIDQKREAVKRQNASVLESLVMQVAQNQALAVMHERAMDDANKAFAAHERLYQAGAIDIFNLLNANTEKQNALQDWFEHVVRAQNAIINLNFFRRGLADTAG